MTPTLAPAANEPQVAPPGDLAIWFFILAELLAFAVFFAAYAFARAKNPALFDEMQLTLNRDAGAVNTLLLISASWCVARGVHAVVANNDSARASRWLLGGLAGGAGFLVVKLFEYAHVFGEGTTLSTNTFYMFYISLTFFHFLHVLVGLFLLLRLARRTRAGLYGPGRMHGLESAAVYWHMVDLLWIMLFPLLYMAR